MAVRGTGKAGQGPVWLWMLRSTQGYYATVGELGEDFGVPGYDKLDGGIV